MTTYPDVEIMDLQAAVHGWPGSPEEKALLAALVLRVRIERAAAGLPRTVIAAKPDVSMIERRLYLSIGQPELSSADQVRRMRTVAGALEAYTAICEILHGRSSESAPSSKDLDAWTSAVNALEDDLYPRTVDRTAPAERSLLGASAEA